VARWLRAAGYAAILAIMPAKAVAELFVGSVPRGGIDRHTYDIANFGHPVPGSVSGGPGWGGEIVILLVTAFYLAVMLALTARRASVAPGTLAIGARTGLLLGLVMYTVVLLGLETVATDPWPHIWVAYPLGALALALMFSGPFAAGVLAGRRCPLPANPARAHDARAWQGLAAGVVSNGVGALTVTVLGTGTIALMLKSAGVRAWLYHGQHVTASAVYGRELYASQSMALYTAICIVLPVIGLAMGVIGSACANLLGPLPEPTAQKARA
jgi:hypothetical protein